MTALLEPAATSSNIHFMWLEVTGRCQLRCAHCYADSSPAGTDGTMTVEDWTAVLDQGATLGVDLVQFIGGEPLLYRGLPTLVDHALATGMQVEVYTNLVNVTHAMWGVLDRPGVRLATSYYSDDAVEHFHITGRNTLHRTQANIVEAVRRGIPVRAGVIDILDGQRVDEARARLADLGVTDVGVDRMRRLGRPAQGHCDASELCGRCGDGIAAVLPDGSITPCPLGRWLAAGNVKAQPLGELVGDVRRISEQVIWPAVASEERPCEPKCNPGCDPSLTSPGGGDGCIPKAACEPNKPAKDPCGPEFTCQPKPKK